MCVCACVLGGGGGGYIRACVCACVCVCSSLDADTGNQNFLFTDWISSEILMFYGLRILPYIYGRPLNNKNDVSTPFLFFIFSFTKNGDTV